MRRVPLRRDQARADRSSAPPENPLCGDSAGGPSQADRAHSPGSEQGNSAAFDEGQRVAGPGGQGALADDDEAGFGPFVEPFGVGGSAAVVGGQEDIGRRLRGRPRDQLDESQLLQITGQEQVAAGEGDVEHEAAGVVGSLRVPAGGWVQDREPNAGPFPRTRGAVIGWTGMPRD